MLFVERTPLVNKNTTESLSHWRYCGAQKHAPAALIVSPIAISSLPCEGLQFPENKHNFVTIRQNEAC